MNEKSIKFKSLFKVVFVLVVIFFIGGVGGVYVEQRILPIIRTNKYLSRIDFLKHSAENVTVITKTEQVTIKEDDSINDIASQASNAVVNIISIGVKNDLSGRPITSADQSGTGFIVTSDGVIVTYRTSIIEKGANYKVLLSNGASYDAKQLGIDEFSNLAFLKIEATNLTAISFADSANVHPGKKLVAIGNSFGEYQNRYAAGLLSNINKTYNLAGKTVSSSEKLEGVFESDFIGQEEYVGGPLIGYSGDMVGLEGSVVIDGQDKYFQIPANVVRKTLESVLAGEFQNRPFFGAYYVSITREYAVAHNLSREKGAIIFSPSGNQGLAMMYGSSADKAGLKINDIILTVGGKEINIDNPLSNLINEYKKGDLVELGIERAGKELKVSVQL